MNRVQVTEEDKRRVGVALSEGACALEHVGEASPLRERAVHRPLNNGAVSHGVGEGNAQLDAVRATLCQGVEEVPCGGEIRISGRDIGDQGPTAISGEALKGLIDAILHERNHARTRLIKQRHSDAVPLTETRGA